MYKKYSKNSTFYMSTKEDFFLNNSDLLEEAIKKNQLYSKQPKRINCKLCQLALTNKIDFQSHGVEYVFCEKCNHLNGIYDDTLSFVEKIYIKKSGEEYASNYLDVNYKKRATEVYLPKLDFLQSILPKKKNKLLDIGTGSGYFVYSALLRNMNAKGLDVSKTMVEFGNSQIQQILGSSPLIYTEEEDFYEQIKSTDADVVSAIGVIEHLRQPNKFFEAFNQSEAEYLYYSVPMFSLSVFLENISKNVFPRQLSGGHTHLFTEESIVEMNKILNVSALGEWRFGTDIMDLYRHLIVNLHLNDVSQKMIEYLQSGIGSNLDDLQKILDLNHFCSEIHVVAAKI